MRRYDVVSKIFFILSIIDFALAAPVLQEKSQACVDVVHMPKDVIHMLGKRWDDELGEMIAKYFKNIGKPVESSDAHASSSSTAPGPDDGSRNVVQAPAPNPASSTAMQGYDSDRELTHWDDWTNLEDPPPPGPAPPNPGASADSYFDWTYWTLKDPPPPRPATPKESGLAGPSSTAAKQGDDDDELHEKLYAITSTGYDSGHELTHAPQPNPNPNPDKWPWTDPDFDWDYWTNLEDSAPPKRPKLFGQAPENQVEHANVQQPNPGPPTDPDIDWKYWMNLDDPPPPRPSPEKFGQAHVEHVR